jgi:hypothetical protein
MLLSAAATRYRQRSPEIVEIDAGPEASRAGVDLVTWVCVSPAAARA